MRRPASPRACPLRSLSPRWAPSETCKGTGIAAAVPRPAPRRPGHPRLDDARDHAKDRTLGTLKGRTPPALAPGYDAELSDDLTGGVFAPGRRSPTPPTSPRSPTTSTPARTCAAPAPASTACSPTRPAPSPRRVQPDPFLQKPRVAGATEDAQHVLFETNLDLTADAARQLRQALQDRRRNRQPRSPPAGRPAPAAPRAPASAASPGMGVTDSNYAPGVLSADGSRVELTSPVGATGHGQLDRRCRSARSSSSTIAARPPATMTP